ncbi:MAG: N-formylglutamate amidohydrolase [Bdellovibrionaceae bacterium]|nr:N-formylglutamate amidohydrolase [Pseudobdellovibrionaceae bacterium]
MSQKPFFVTIPHSGEEIPSQTPWLMNLPEETLMRDVDRYVDRLYEPVISKLNIPVIKTKWHRYAVDLNRLPEDIDQKSVVQAKLEDGHERGYHWSVTTYNETLMNKPMSIQSHQELTDLIYSPFHKEIEAVYEYLRKSLNVHTIYHLDLHSMPSRGTEMHADPGEYRADVVISDCDQRSCQAPFRDLVIAAYVTAGFKVAYNWPYKGGRLSQQYGKPAQGQQSIQVELNRALYMNEINKKIIPESAKVKEKLANAIETIYRQL